MTFLDCFVWLWGMNLDISRYLDSWEYQPGKIVVRKIKGKDGNPKIQLRVDLGILQMNLTGRPDGKLPFGHATLFEHYLSRLAKYADAQESDPSGFKLSIEDCSKLQQEAIQFHHRYICLFQLKDYDAVIRDTERNLAVFDFVNQFADSPEFAANIGQLRPQLLMMRARAKGSKEAEADQHSNAIHTIEQTMEEIRAFFREQNRPELADLSGEIQSLQQWSQEIRSTRPLSQREQLEQALQEAVRREDYEKAAEVRDALRNLKSVL